MPALNFKKEFVSLIDFGIKRQTIRPLRKVPIKPGDKLYLYSGMRTKSCVHLGEVYCCEVLSITIRRLTNNTCNKYAIAIDTLIDDPSMWHVNIAGHPPMSRMALFYLAKMDGFSDEEQMLRWFKNQYKLKPGDEWLGNIIRW